MCVEGVGCGVRARAPIVDRQTVHAHESTPPLPPIHTHNHPKPSPTNPPQLTHPRAQRLVLPLVLPLLHRHFHLLRTPRPLLFPTPPFLLLRPFPLPLGRLLPLGRRGQQPPGDDATRVEEEEASDGGEGEEAGQEEEAPVDGLVATAPAAEGEQAGAAAAAAW